MNSSQQTALVMKHPARWLACLRIVVGLYFAKAVVTKLTITLAYGFLPIPAVQQRWLTVMPTIVEKQASQNPIPFYKHFLDATVLTHSDTFARLTAWGEATVGIGLTLGLLTRMASLVGLFLVLNYGLATQWMSASQQGFHLVLGVLMLSFFAAGAGRVWGLDSRVLRTRRRSGLQHRPRLSHEHPSAERSQRWRSRLLSFRSRIFTTLLLG